MEERANGLIAGLEQAQREELEREARRISLMEEIAKYRWHVAKNFHRNDQLRPLDFKDRPYQEPIYLDTATRLVVNGSVQWGKTEFLIVVAAVMAAMGLRVFYVSDKAEKRDRIVASRMNPAFENVPLYRGFIESAKAKGRHAESLRMKHVGDGIINFVGSNSEKDFSTFSADAAIVDEHQLCDQDNLGKIDHRMSGSPYRYKIIVGNPRAKGTEENQNLDWEYQNTDQRRWFVACPTCREMQVIDWWTHIVKEERNKAGGIIQVVPRDEQWSEGSAFDLRPICPHCRRPMNRLSREGVWRAMNPGHPDHGYNLSNIYNVFTPLAKMYQMYRAALHDPSKMAGFVNDQLGLSYTLDGVAITDQMLAQSSTGELCGLQPYTFLPASAIDWKDVELP